MLKGIYITGLLLLLLSVGCYAQTVKVAPQDRFKLQEAKPGTTVGAAKTNTAPVAATASSQTKGTPVDGRQKTAQPLTAENRFIMEQRRQK